MFGDLLTLPIRLSARAATLALRGTEGVVNHALAIAGRVAGRPDAPEEPVSAEPDRRIPEPERATPANAQPPAPEPRPVEPLADERDLYAETPAEPEHISEEPVLVEEFAEPGAEDGAGAEIRIDEPWGGYAQMKAQDVIERITAATSAELAAIALYESANQNRQTVLSAAERQLELTNRGGFQN